VNTPSELRYTESDEWVREEADGTFTLGITDYAQDALGEIVYAELPQAGQNIEPGAQFGVVESVKAVGELHSPLGGHVVAANEAVLKQPEVLNGSPYQDGWLLRLQPASPPDLSGLMDAQSYADYRS